MTDKKTVPERTPEQQAKVKAALDYHRYPKPGKLEITPTKPMGTQNDLSLAYSPGVAFPCEEIARDPSTAALYTARGNLVGVITNGTAVLGLGAIGPAASKPVMEGKGVLFKKFAGIDVFDIEIAETDPDKLVEIIASLEPTFGAINLEDIKAPECFEVEDKLRARMKIPVFHDDQHGTAICVAAAILNGLRVIDKKISEVKLVTSGAGAAALACLDLLVDMGMKLEHITATDLAGVVYHGRNELMDPRKDRYARKTSARTLAEVIEGADIFLGLSAPGVLKPEMLMKMAARPLVMALANPTPEILPDLARQTRPDAIIATGRSDYPNQVNNVLCFPFIFRGALDCGATTINEAMKIACVKAIADLAMAEASEIVALAYHDQELSFGPDYIIPKPFDPRLIVEIAPAVAKAAMDSGVATRPIADLEQYRESLNTFVFRSGQVMRPLFEAARSQMQRVVYAEGEDDRVLRTAQQAVDDKLAQPILIGRPEVISRNIARLGLRLVPEQNVLIVNPNNDPRYHHYCDLYHSIMERQGITPENARLIVRTNSTVIAALMLKRGEADAMICGTSGGFDLHLADVAQVIGMKPNIKCFSTLSAMVLPTGTYFFCDTQVNLDPTAEQIADMTIHAAAEVRFFGMKPKIALLSHSNFGSSSAESAVKMRRALEIIRRKDPELEVEGEMQGGVAFAEDLRERIFPNSRLSGKPNLLIMPSLDAANITVSVVRHLADGLTIGPILLGAALPVHIATPAVSVRGLVNLTAIAAVDAQFHQADSPLGEEQ
ncbi:MAG: NADP-dependent malic enzyme [Candidatus Pacebacteria bacterium]|nr:NADP-dependent malic enzyme [Candidatus Paceibacterota bacterium]